MVAWCRDELASVLLELPSVDRDLDVWQQTRFVSVVIL
jgi:hypothetical protein